MGTRLLADLGADVVKVEPPIGDHTRHRSPLRGGMSRYFAQLNAGKRSIVLDLKDSADLEVARRLAASADVLVENNRPGVMARLGLGYETVAALNPAVVYCAISGFGQLGPLAHTPAYAPTIHAASGYDLANFSYQVNATEPAGTAIFIADALAAVYACAAIEAAVLQRCRTGEGQFIDLALLDTMLSLMVFEVQIAQTHDRADRSVFRPMKTLDGYVAIAAVNQTQCASLLDLIGSGEAILDPRWATPEARERNWEPLMDVVATWTATRTSDACLTALAGAGVPAAPYRSVAEVLDDPHVRERGVLAPQADAGGDFALVNPPFSFADGSVHIRGAAPALGEHRETVLTDWLG